MWRQDNPASSVKQSDKAAERTYREFDLLFDFFRASAPDVLKISLKIVSDKAFLRLDYQKKPTIYEMNVEDINCFDFSKFWDLVQRFKRVQDKIDDIEKDFG